MHNPPDITAKPPRIADNRQRNDDTMHVEYVLADGRRAVVHVPYDRWVEGGHTPVGPALAALVADLDLQHARAAARVVGQGE